MPVFLALPTDHHPERSVKKNKFIKFFEEIGVEISIVNSQWNLLTHFNKYFIFHEITMFFTMLLCGCHTTVMFRAYPILSLLCMISGKNCIYYHAGPRHNLKGRKLFRELKFFLVLKCSDTLVVPCEECIEEFQLCKYRSKIKIGRFPTAISRGKSKEERTLEFSYIGNIQMRSSNGARELDVLAEAAVRLQQITDHEFRIHVFGIGSDRSRLETVFGDRAVFYGWIDQEEVQKVLSKSRFIILPSVSEGLASICIEALYCGCNLIVSNIGGNQFFNKHFSNNTIAYQSGNVEQLLDALLIARSKDLQGVSDENLKLFGSEYCEQLWLDILDNCK